jgi:hypothetical protein
MANPTTNYGWVLPIDQGSPGAWGAMIDAVYQAIDTALFAVSTVASNALARAGGVMTGRIDVLTSTMARVDMGSISGAQVLNLALGQYFTLTVGGALGLSFTNTPAGANVTGVVLRITNGNSSVITWPVGTKWPGGTVPVLTTAGIDLVVLITDDNGATWRGVVVGKDIK